MWKKCGTTIFVFLLWGLMFGQSPSFPKPKHLLSFQGQMLGFNASFTESSDPWLIEKADTHYIFFYGGNNNAGALTLSQTIFPKHTFLYGRKMVDYLWLTLGAGVSVYRERSAMKTFVFEPGLRIFFNDYLLAGFTGKIAGIFSERPNTPYAYGCSSYIGGETRTNENVSFGLHLYGSFTYANLDFFQGYDVLKQKELEAGLRFTVGYYY